MAAALSLAPPLSTGHALAHDGPSPSAAGETANGLVVRLPVASSAPAARGSGPTPVQSPRPSPSSAQPAVAPYPRNLHRVYDGSWEIISSASSSSGTSGPARDISAALSSVRGVARGTNEDDDPAGNPPFHAVPLPLDDILGGSNNLSQRNGTSKPPRGPITSEFGFEKRTGFALLTAENRESNLGHDINLVFGEILIRDGAYRSPHDVSLRLIGVYEWAVGRLVVVGDLLYEDIHTALHRLYSTFARQHTSLELAALAARNITEDSFIATLTPVFAKHRKQFRNQLGAMVPPGTPSVPAQCPFTASISIKQGSFTDKLPVTVDSSGIPNFPSADPPSPAPAVPNGGMSSGGLLVGAGLGGRPALVLGTQQGGTISSKILLSGTSESLSGDKLNFGVEQKLEQQLRVLEERRRSLAPAQHQQQQQEPQPQVPQSNANKKYDDNGSDQDELVEMTGILDSEACDTHLNIVLSTLDTETLFGKAINYTLLVTFVAFAQVIVLIRQMEMTSTQAGASKVSLMTIGLQAVADSYLCLGHLTMGIAVPTLFNAFATAAFFKFIIFSIFEMRYMLLIWKARRPSGFSEGWEAMRRELSMLYSRFYGSLLLGIVLLYQMQNHLVYFLFALYSFWLPQIVLSVYEDHRKALHPLYIVGMSSTRLAIPLYFWGCPRNFLHVQPRYWTAVGLVGWVAFQACVLLSQHKYGPRWFVPKPLLPEKYDYFRDVDCSTIHGGDYVDLEGGGGAEVAEGRRSSAEPTDGDPGDETGTLLVGKEVECVICMTPVQIASRDRMVTPCNHFFHSACLEQWLNVKLECAVCRSTVPPP
jgi:hypothetical protein